MNIESFVAFAKANRIFKVWEEGNIRPMLVGGFGIKLAVNRLDKKRNSISRFEQDLIQNTEDLDLHFNIKNTNYKRSPYKAYVAVYQFLSNVIRRFAEEKNIDLLRFNMSKSVKIETGKTKKNFKFVPINDKRTSVPKIGNTKIYYIIPILLDGKPFIDATITSEPYVDLSKNMLLNKAGLKDTGMPIKTIKGYIEEMISVSIRELIPNKYREYQKRNPIVGTHKIKGYKDAVRLKVLCNYVKDGSLIEPCILIRMLFPLIKHGTSIEKSRAKNILNKYSKLIGKNISKSVPGLVV